MSSREIRSIMSLIRNGDAQKNLRLLAQAVSVKSPNVPDLPEERRMALCPLQPIPGFYIGQARSWALRKLRSDGSRICARLSADFCFLLLVNLPEGYAELAADLGPKLA